jgi:uncharacterized linocin/CFP29 family protein
MNIAMNGADGPSAVKLLKHNFDTGCLRPFIGDDGNNYITVRNGTDSKGNPVFNNLVTNAPTTLRKDEWKLFDTAVVRAAKDRLRLWSDLQAAGLTFNIPQGMGKTILEHEIQSDISAADVSMDGIVRTEEDRPEYTPRAIPLPIIHKDFSFTARQIAASRNLGAPLDTTTAELAARRVAEEVEKFVAGSITYTYGSNSVEGYKNFADRNTKALTAPTAGGWTPATLVTEVLDMKSTSQSDKMYGPWFCYNSPDWDEYLDDDYSAAKGDNTLRDRIGAIEGIDRPTTADYLSNWDFILVQKQPETVRAVTGMDMTTVQWESQGGMLLNFKVMAIMVPQIRSSFPETASVKACGIVHGS